MDLEYTWNNDKLEIETAVNEEKDSGDKMSSLCQSKSTKYDKEE